MVYTADGIWTPDDSDKYRPVPQLASTAETIQTALEKRANSYIGTSTQRVTFTGNAPAGTIWSDTNGDRITWIKRGIAWSQVWPIEKIDTGWVNCAYASGFSAGTAGQLKARRIDNIVYVVGGIAGTIPFNQYTQIATLPAQIPGPSAISPIRGGAAGQGGKPALYEISSSKSIIVAPSVTGVPWIAINASYPID